MLKRFVFVAAAAALSVIPWAHAASTQSPLAAPDVLQFVFTSDAHYGLTRPDFRGGTNVPAAIVNAALVRAINALPSQSFPRDGGLRASSRVGAIDFVAEGGDVVNREEAGIQPAAQSWAEFTRDYIDGLTVVNRAGRRAPVFVVPGNHDASNVVGFHRAMTPATDATAYTAIYNMMMKPAVPLTPATVDYSRDRVLTSRDIGGIHFQFISIWPDSQVRRWMAVDLTRVSASTPVIVFTHDQPDVEAKHFRNPNGAHDINSTDQFENLLADLFTSGKDINAASTNEERELERFLQTHPNITAYFHGNSNWNQFYDWTGPGYSALVHVFRVDSPMKGAFSAADEAKLSFQVGVLDPVSRMLTVREALWNATRGADAPSIHWGASTTVALLPRPTAVRPSSQ